MNTHPNPSENGNDSTQITALLEGQVQDLKAQLTRATDEKQQLLVLANNLQKQNEVLMLPTQAKKEEWVQRLDDVFSARSV